jgi:hypothetical protein
MQTQDANLGIGGEFSTSTEDPLTVFSFCRNIINVQKFNSKLDLAAWQQLGQKIALKIIINNNYSDSFYTIEGFEERH